MVPKNGRHDLPWRKNPTAYRVLVAEVMLQQTQVSRVIPKCREFLRRFPTVQKLAKATPREVLLAWSGLGYNRRALNLQKAAQKIVTEHRGQFPKSKEDLQKLPGVGEYTASAILSFSFNADVACIDTNIRRVLISEFGLSHTISKKDVQRVAEAALPKGRSRDWHNALMDYGSLVLTARKSGVKSSSKQSRFQGSIREVRGHIVRQLLKKKRAKASALYDDSFPRERFEKALKSLLKDQTVQQKHGWISFATKS